MKNAKRIISVVLVVVMLLTVSGISVSAAEKANMVPADRTEVVYWPTFKDGEVKSVHLAIPDSRITKIRDGAVGKVYWCPDSRITVKGNPPEIVAEDGAIEEVEKYWQNPTFNQAFGKIKYIGEVTANDMYIGERDYKDIGTFNMIGLGDPYNSLHIDLRGLNLSENYGDYAIIFEDGAFMSADGSVVSDRVVINGFLDFSENLTGVMKLSYFLVTFIQIFNFKYLSKGY